MKKFICAALAAMCMGSVFSGCTSNNEKKVPDEFAEPPEIGFLIAEQFIGYKLGVEPSLVSKETVEQKLPDTYVLTYKTVTKGLHAVAEKDIHGMVLPILYADEEIRRTPGIGKIEQTFVEQPVCAMFLNDSNYVLPVDAAFTAIKANGKAKRIALSHSPYASEELSYTRPEEYEKAPGRVVRIGICSDENYPFNYKKDGELVGVNVDMAYEIAAGANAELEIKEYAEKDLEAALLNKEVDVVLSEYIYSDELYDEGSDFGKKKLLLSESYYDASLVIVAKSEYLTTSKDVLAQLEAEAAEQVQAEK